MFSGSALLSTHDGRQRFEIQPHIRHYDWGGFGRRSFLRQFLGSTDMKSPFAEAWYGTYPLGTSLFQPLGRASKTSAPLSIPFLVKVLEVARPLSLQIHPNPVEARQGFAREQLAGLGLQDPRRIFKDPEGKPECVVAVTPFSFFAGVRSFRQILSDPLCRPLAQGTRGLKSGRGSWWSVLDRLAQWTPPEIKAISSRILLVKGTNSRIKWVQKLVKNYGVKNGDRAALLVPFLQYHDLAPGQAIYLPAGVPHLYLGGVGIELTGPSDNVYRLGLTFKPTHFEKGVRLLRDLSPKPKVFDLKRPATVNLQGEKIRIGFERRGHGVFWVRTASVRLELPMGKILAAIPMPRAPRAGRV